MLTLCSSVEVLRRTFPLQAKNMSTESKTAPRSKQKACQNKSTINTKIFAIQKKILRGINFVKITKIYFPALIQNLATLVWFLCNISAATNSSKNYKKKIQKKTGGELICKNFGVNGGVSKKLAKTNLSREAHLQARCVPLQAEELHGSQKSCWCLHSVAGSFCTYSWSVFEYSRAFLLTVRLGATSDIHTTAKKKSFDCKQNSSNCT